MRRPQFQTKCRRCQKPQTRQFVVKAGPICKQCSRRIYRLKTAQEWSHQARRYRMILHVLGWEHEQFEEMFAEMKRSPMQFRRAPESRQANIDWASERRYMGTDLRGHQ